MVYDGSRSSLPIARTSTGSIIIAAISTANEPPQAMLVLCADNPVFVCVHVGILVSIYPVESLLEKHNML